MIVSDLSSPELVERLASHGLFIRTGPFLFQIRTKLLQLAQGLALLYSDFTAEVYSDFADFHVRFDRSRSWRGCFRPHVVADVDGVRPSVPVPAEQAFAIFEGCLNWCIYTHAHQYLIIHAAAVERYGKAVILPAPPGSGKSTLCAALVNRGWRLLTDELVLIDMREGKIVPIARPVSLKNESIEVIKNFAPQAVFGPLSPNTIKGTVAHMKPPADSVARAGQHCEAAWLVLPKFKPEQPTASYEIPQAEAFMRIAESAVNYMMLGQPGFDLVSRLVDQTHSYRLEYSDLNDVVLWFNELSADD